MKDVKIKFTADTTEATKNVDNLANSTKDLSKDVDKVSESSDNLGGSVDAMTGGAVSGFKKFAGGLKTIALGFRGVGGAIAASGIGLIVVTIAAVTAAFKSTEEGQNKFAKLMGMIGAVTGVLTDRLAAFGRLVIDVFTKPKEVLKSFRDSIKEYVTDQIALVVDGLGLLGSAIKKAFSGDVSGALDDAGAGMKKLLVETSPMYQAVVALTDATKGLVKEMTEEARMAGIIADQRAKADKLDRALILDRAIANRERAKLLEQALDKEKFSTKERIEFLKEAGRIEDEITQKEIEATALRLKAKQAENALGDSAKEDLDEEINLKARLIDLETAKLRKAKLVTTQIIALNAEEVASNKAKSDAIKAQTAQDLADEKALKDKYDAFTTNTAEEKRVAAQDKLRTEFDALLLQMGEDEEAKLELTKSYLEKQQALTDEYADAEEVARAEAAAKEIADAKAVKDAIDGVKQAELNTISNGIGLIKQLGEESRGLQAAALIGESAVGIANMTINKGKADLAAQPLLSNPATAGAGVTALALNKINLGIGIATNVAATAKGLSALKKGGAPAGGGSEAGGGTAQAPSFNLVEGTDDSSAIQRSIEGQGNAPIKAYVTSGDVTSAQAADRAAEANSGF